jgi:sialidase-1
MLYVCLLVVGVPTCGEPLRAADEGLEKTDLFEAGNGGYALYRIPGVVVTSKGTVLAYCEARKNAGGDWGHIDVLLRRSTDGGKTWQAAVNLVKLDGKFERNPLAVAQNLGKPGEITINNPVAIADRKTGAVHFLYCIEYGRCFYMRSDDDGVTFSKPVEITATFEKFRPEYAWKVLATGPGHGIQLQNGRLIVPVWLSTGTGGHAHRPSVASVIYSDDQGANWERGEIAVPNTTEWVNPSETVAVELADGRVMLNVRSESKNQRRLVSVSKDGATGWSRPMFQEELLEPICMASIVRLARKPESDKNRILFANPHNLKRADGKVQPGLSRDRMNLSLQLSEDEGASWQVRKVLEPGFSGYSDLAVDRSGSIFCFYERGATDGKNIYRTRYLTVARFNLEWLTK